MRDYVVQAGDSPARIAVAYAGCPKCVGDLIDANPHKPVRRFPNGFRTFESLRVGEHLALPDKWFDGTLDAVPRDYFDSLPMMPTAAGGLGAHAPMGVGVTVPPVSTNGTSDFVSGPISIGPCHQVLMTVFPIPQGIIAGDVSTVLADLGFTVVWNTPSTSGGQYVNAINKSTSVTYNSNPADAQNVIGYINEGAPWANSQTVNPWQAGEIIIGATSGASATISGVNDDVSNQGSGILSLTNSTGTFQWGEKITGSISGNFATALVYGAVMTSPSGNGMIGVTNLTDTGVNAACQNPTPCPTGWTRNPSTGVCSPIYQIPGGLPGAGTGACTGGLVADTATGKCVAPCANGDAPVNGVCAPGGATAAKFIYTGGHRIQAVGVMAGGAALPPSLATATVASVQAQLQGFGSIQYKVVSVTPSTHSITFVFDYCGPATTVTEPSTGVTVEGDTVHYTHTDMGASPTSCAPSPGGAPNPNPGGVTAPASTTSTGTIAAVGVLALLGAGGLWYAFR